MSPAGPANGSGPVSWAQLDPTLREIGERLARLEVATASASEGAQQRRNRAWLVIMAVATGIVCPVVVTAVITLLHLASGH